MTYPRLTLLALLTSTTLLAQKFEVHLTPRSHQGDVFVYTATGALFREASTAGKILSQEEFSAEFEAKAEVLAVDASGEPVRLSLTVSRCTKTESGATTDVLKPGAVVLVDGGAKNPFSIDGSPVSDDVRKVFEVVYSSHKPGAVSDDEVFGAKEPKAIGDTWPIDAQLASEDLKTSGIDVAPEHLKGTTTLMGKDKVGANDCLSISVQFDATGIAMKDLPNGATVDEGTLAATLDGCVPLAGASYRKGAAMNLKARFTVNASTIDFVSRQKSKVTWMETGK